MCALWLNYGVFNAQCMETLNKDHFAVSLWSETMKFRKKYSKKNTEKNAEKNVFQCE